MQIDYKEVDLSGSFTIYRFFEPDINYRFVSIENDQSKKWVAEWVENEKELGQVEAKKQLIVLKRENLFQSRKLSAIEDIFHR